MSSPLLRVAMVAGEASGDILGARSIAALRDRFGEIEVTGIGGPLMQAEGMQSLFPMERLSVMGFVDPLLRLPELLRIRRDLFHHFYRQPPDFFLGIDAPDFNLGLARRLRREGIATAHLVSPSIWAWRAGRIHRISKAVDLMLCLFPFEVPLYQRAGVAARCVGHPLAQSLTPADGMRRSALRLELGIPEGTPVLGLLPGSRASEVTHIGPAFVQAAQRLGRDLPMLKVLVAASDAERLAQISALLPDAETLPVSLLEGRSRDVMSVADALLVASGTATLEAALLDAPMVVGYRMQPLSWALVSRLVRTPYAALPNILSGRAVVPECIQGAMTTDALTAGLLPLFAPGGGQAQRAAFAKIRASLAVDFGLAFTQAVQERLLQRG
ncbi:lipid-A-disaccharide synthase [Chromatocurvus halotolerans]|uniref:Lipid-A-disaccharide synthase n=1 Tax=Chromatocurvus halotolerans TaxID=1132028 RepID=A0A4R2KSY5_9GAMM|nr:lipid-A-disaccharide synthase [Chromatocurvus halotolerans]TCO75912.1 lipid-A-disaccharide synthase [Chromatocurvus halotolerans]